MGAQNQPSPHDSRRDFTHLSKVRTTVTVKVEEHPKESEKEIFNLVDLTLSKFKASSYSSTMSMSLRFKLIFFVLETHAAEMLSMLFKCCPNTLGKIGQYYKGCAFMNHYSRNLSVLLR